MPDEPQTNATVSLQEKFDLKEDFPTPTYEEWKEAAVSFLKGAPFDKKLKTKTYEGITLEPMYFRSDVGELAGSNKFPGEGDFLRGTGTTGYLNRSWEICQETSCSTAEEFNSITKKEIAKGITAISPKLMTGSGFTLSTEEEFKTAFEGINLNEWPVYVNTGSSVIKTLELLKKYAADKGIELADVKGAFEADPVGILAEYGCIGAETEKTFDDMAASVKWAIDNKSSLRTVGVDSTAYVNAGASAVQELSYAFTTAVEYINRMLDRGLSIDEVAGRVRFTMAVSPNFFMEIAKFRAARVIWSKIVKSYGGSEESAALYVHARTSAYSQTKYDPYVNMLRTTTEAFSAVVGGVNSIHTSAFNEITGKEDDFARRISRNVQIILKEESHMDQLIDPAGGSFYIEKLTEEILNAAWKGFQAIEADGGMVEALKTGAPQKAITEVAEKRWADTAKRKAKVVGVNMYANTTEEKPEAFVERASVEEIAAKMAESSDFKVDALNIHRIADKYEGMRDDVFAFNEKEGRNPKLFLANMGGLGQYKARADFTKGFFETGAFEVVYPKGFATPEDAAKAAVEAGVDAVAICSTDDTYPEIVPAFIKALGDAKEKLPVILAGFPKDQIDAHKEAGVDEFIYMGADNYGIISRLHKRIGVMS